MCHKAFVYTEIIISFRLGRHRFTQAFIRALEDVKAKILILIVVARDECHNRQHGCCKFV